jgi:hypothetical protein
VRLSAPACLPLDHHDEMVVLIHDPFDVTIGWSGTMANMKRIVPHQSILSNRDIDCPIARPQGALTHDGVPTRGCRRPATAVRSVGTSQTIGMRRDQANASPRTEMVRTTASAIRMRAALSRVSRPSPSEGSVLCRMLMHSPFTQEGPGARVR